MSHRRIVFLAAAFWLAGSFAGPTAQAQHSSGGGAAVSTFEAAFFDPFNPQTALDLVSRVPGFSLEAGGEKRGLASDLGNVLIDGRRPSSKAGVERLLQRLPAANVERVELIREAVPGVDMAGQDQLVNVVTRRGAGWTGAWRSRVQVYESGRATPDGEISGTRTARDSTLTLSFDAENSAAGRDIVRDVGDGTLSPVRTETERAQDNFIDIAGALAYQRNFDAGHALRVDARAWRWWWRQSRFNVVSSPDGAVVRSEPGRIESEGAGAEVSVDYDHVFSRVWSGQFTALQRIEPGQSDQLFEQVSPSGAFLGAVRVDDEDTAGETILRAELRRAPDERRSLTLIAEAAYNVLDGSLALFDVGPGGETPIPLPVSDARVEEQRIDLAALRVWRPVDAWTFEARLGGEFSRISQTGDAEQEREFTYFKPAASATWAPNDRDRVRLALDREVAQLSFPDFISAVDISDDLTDIGNPNLEPERTWSLEAQWRRRFSQDGAFTLAARYDRVEAVQDLIPTAGGLLDAPGNLGDGDRFVLEADLTAPLGRLGVSGGLLNLSAELRETRVDDPVTGQTRRFRGEEDWSVTIDFRQDLQARSIAWGAAYTARGDQDFFRVGQFDRTAYPEGDADLFIERRLANGLTLRADARLQLGEEQRERYLWALTRADGAPILLEARERDFDASVFLGVQGRF